MEMKERNDAIMAANQTGASYAEIGRQHGLSGVRVKQIIERRVRKLRVQAGAQGLSVRALNALHNEGFALDDWEGILARPSKEWLAVHNLGKKSYAEILAHCLRMRKERA